MNLKFFEWLRERVHFGETYTETDRYRDYRRTFLDTPHGRRVLHELIEQGHVFTSTLVPGAPDLTQNNEGQRSMVLDILAVLNSEPAPLEVETEKDEMNA